MTYLAAAIQMNAGPDKLANLERAERLVRVASRARCEPRRAARGLQLARQAQRAGRRGRNARRSIAHADVAAGARAQIHIVAGSITEHAAAGESRCYNTSALLGPDGARIAVYRKIHLFDVDLPGRVTVRESDAKIAGADVVTAATPLGTIGLTICYDLRFPELYRAPNFCRCADHRDSERVHVSRPARRIGRRWCARARSRTRPT